MELQHININELKCSPLNVRKKGGKSVSDLIPSIRELGIIQPLLVRPNGSGYEIVAGQRRFHALHTLAQEQCLDPVPCLIMEKDDDAKAIEASLAENVARLPMDDIDQFKAFSALMKKGLSIEDIASRFTISLKQVKQRLAIADLIPPLITAYRRQKIDAPTLRILTMATKKQQRAWLELFKSDENNAPEGYALKRWLFGGTEIDVANALFDLDEYDGVIVTDLFEDQRYFSDCEKFWALQSNSVAQLKEKYLQSGWTEVIVLDVGEYFPSYEYVDASKNDGGKVYISLSASGEVRCYEGQLSRKEIKVRERAKQKADGLHVETERPELTKPMQNYLDLHRHSAVRTALLNHSDIALRLAIAQIIAGSSLWTVHADPQKASNEKIGASLSDNKAQSSFLKKRKSIAKLINLELEEDATIVPRKNNWDVSRDISEIFSALLNLDDKAVMKVVSFIVAETLPSGSELIDAVGERLNIDMSDYWSPDDVFFGLLRDKSAINAIVKEVAGKAKADAHLASTAKVQKQVIQDCLTNERKNEHPKWVPRYMKFPIQYYRH